MNTKTKPAPHALCGAKTRGAKTCANQAGFRTEHLGEGRCFLHGGKSPIKHGRYSSVSRPRVRELLERLASEPDPLDLLPEAQLVRAIAVDFVERYDEIRDALLAWNSAEFAEAAAEERRARPQPIPSMHEVASLAEKVAKIVSAITQQKKEGSISLETFNRVMEQMGVSVARHVKDAAALRRIEAEWLAIQVA